MQNKYHNIQKNSNVNRKNSKRQTPNSKRQTLLLLKPENRSNADRIAHHRSKNLFEFECNRQEPSTSCPPDLSSDECFLFVVGQILSRLLILSLDEFEERVNEKAQMSRLQNSKTCVQRFRRKFA